MCLTETKVTLCFVLGGMIYRRGKTMLIKLEIHSNPQSGSVCKLDYWNIIKTSPNINQESVAVFHWNRLYSLVSPRPIIRFIALMTNVLWGFYVSKRIIGRGPSLVHFYFLYIPSQCLYNYMHAVHLFWTVHLLRPYREIEKSIKENRLKSYGNHCESKYTVLKKSWIDRQGSFNIFLLTYAIHVVSHVTIATDCDI